MSLGDSNEVYRALQNLYSRAESLMLKPEGYKLLLTLLSDIRHCFENSINCKNSIVVEKQQFEDRVQRWIKDTENKLSKRESRFFA